MAYNPVYIEAGEYRGRKWKPKYRCYMCGNEAPTAEEIVHTNKFGICEYGTQEAEYWKEHFEIDGELPDDIDEWTDEILEEHHRKINAIGVKYEISKWMLNQLPESEYERIMKNRRG